MSPACATLVLLVGCRYADVIESTPYVLSTGLGELRAIAPGPDGAAFVAGPKGVLSVAGDGKPTPALEGDARLVALQADRLYAMQGDVLGWIPIGTAFAGAVGGSQPTVGVTDMLAWCDGELLLAYADRLALWRIGQEVERPFGAALPGIRAVAIGPNGCDSALVVTADALWSVPPNGEATKLAGDLVAPRAAASDRLGRAWVVAGEPASLGRIDGAAVVSGASDLGDVRDLFFGHAGMYAPQNAYLAGGDGRIEYVHVADIPPR